jgi:hypothetical protein
MYYYQALIVGESSCRLTATSTYPSALGNVPSRNTEQEHFIQKDCPLTKEFASTLKISSEENVNSSSNLCPTESTVNCNTNGGTLNNRNSFDRNFYRVLEGQLSVRFENSVKRNHSILKRFVIYVTNNKNSSKLGPFKKVRGAVYLTSNSV